MSDALERAHVELLKATEAALLKPYKSTCSWCKARLISVGHPQSHGICDDCLEREFPEERS